MEKGRNSFDSPIFRINLQRKKILISSLCNIYFCNDVRNKNPFYIFHESYAIYPSKTAIQLYFSIRSIRKIDFSHFFRVEESSKEKKENKTFDLDQQSTKDRSRIKIKKRNE